MGCAYRVALGEDVRNRVRVLDARQPLVEALERVREAPMVDAKAMENGGVQITNVHGVSYDVIREVVGLAVHDASLDAASGHPD